MRIYCYTLNWVLISTFRFVLRVPSPLEKGWDEVCFITQKENPRRNGGCLPKLTAYENL
jgi:hypothetical protein